MKSWEPKDFRKIIVQLYGICLGIGGIVLINTGAKIDGTSIKISLEVFNSELKTANAGVALIFMSFILVLVSVVNIGGNEWIDKLKSIKVGNRTNRGIRIAIIMLLWFSISLLLYYLPNFLKLPSESVLYFILKAAGILSVFKCLQTVFYWMVGDEETKDDRTEIENKSNFIDEAAKSKS